MTLPADILINTGGNKKILSSQQCNGLMASMYGERSGGERDLETLVCMCVSVICS